MHGQAVFTRIGIGTFEGEFAENNMKFGKFTRCGWCCVSWAVEAE